MSAAQATRPSLALLGLVALATTCAGEANAAPEPTGTPVRVVYTATMLRNISESDAKAAIRVWGEALAREMNVAAYSDVEVVPDAGTLARRFHEGSSDFGSVTALEFFEIEPDLGADPMFSLVRGGAPTVTYLLLVRGDGGAKELGDLRGGELRVLDGPRGNLALPWLDLLTIEHGLGPTSELFSRVTRSEKISSVVLPVFFGQANACLVTRDGFETMAELNPQVGRDLRPLTQSPALVPVLSFFRRGFTPYFRDDLIQSILDLPASPTGRQVLSLIQSEGMVLISREDLKPTRELIQAWRRQQSPEHATPSSRSTASTLGGGGR